MVQWGEGGHSLLFKFKKKKSSTSLNAARACWRQPGHRRPTLHSLPVQTIEAPESHLSLVITCNRIVITVSGLTRLLVCK